MANRWYVIHVYSGFEKKVAAAIREQAEQKGLSDMFEEILVPTEEVVEIKRGAKVSAERKFFPGYVLIKMDMSDETWRSEEHTSELQSQSNLVCRLLLEKKKINGEEPAASLAHTAA